MRSTSVTAKENSISSLLYSLGAFPIAVIIPDIPVILCGFPDFSFFSGLPEETSLASAFSLSAFMAASIFFMASGLAPIDLAISIAFPGSMLVPIFFMASFMLSGIFS